MFILELYDSKENKLSPGDIVMIKSRHTTFYCEVKYLEEEQVIAPFHTFSFTEMEKVSEVPADAILSMVETRYKVWHKEVEGSSDYIISWRDCETLLEKRCYRIQPVEAKP
jgi:hypothetical protein